MTPVLSLAALVLLPEAGVVLLATAALILRATAGPVLLAIAGVWPVVRRVRPAGCAAAAVLGPTTLRTVMQIGGPTHGPR